MYQSTSPLFNSWLRLCKGPVNNKNLKKSLFLSLQFKYDCIILIMLQNRYIELDLCKISYVVSTTNDLKPQVGTLFAKGCRHLLQTIQESCIFNYSVEGSLGRNLTDVYIRNLYVGSKFSISFYKGQRGHRNLLICSLRVGVIPE